MTIAKPLEGLTILDLTRGVASRLQGVPRTRLLASFFDGIARHSREGIWFKQAVAGRDSGDPIAAEAKKASCKTRP
jgi:enoyl-CoA hydratase